MLHPALHKQLEMYEAPVIGVHIRRGDFKKGSTITPESFFVDSIQRLRRFCGQELPVTVFSDADPGELMDLFALPCVKPAEPKADILDILLLSRSKICILSIGSTFSYWGAFLNDGIVLKHPGEWHPEIRPAEVNQIYYEGKIDLSVDMDAQLKTNLLQLRAD
jgi:hypothetical protein